MTDIQSTLARLRADLDSLLSQDPSHRIPSNTAAPPTENPFPYQDSAATETRLATAVAWLRAGSLSAKNLGVDTVHSPEWNILLDLYVCHLRRKHPSVSSSCLVAGVPPTTALRHLAILVDTGRIIRTEDAFDKRRTLLRMSEAAVAEMNKIMDDVVDSDRRLGLERMVINLPRQAGS